MTSFRQYQDEITNRSEEHLHPINDWDAMEYACRLAAETGEVCGDLARIRSLQDGPDRPYNADKDPEVLRENVGREIGDVVAFCALLCSRLELDFEEVVVKKFNEVSDRVGSHRKL